VTALDTAGTVESLARIVEAAGSIELRLRIAEIELRYDDRDAPVTAGGVLSSLARRRELVAALAAVEDAARSVDIALVMTTVQAVTRARLRRDSDPLGAPEVTRFIAAGTP
jgi:hypothetical protein